MAEKNCFDITKLICQIMCAMVQWSRGYLQGQINRVRLPAALFSFFFALFFFRLVFVFNTIIPFGLLFFILTADPVDPVLGSIYILSLSPEYILKKGFQELLICILAKLTARKKHKLSRHVPPLK